MALCGGGLVAIKTAANAFGAIKDCAGFVGHPRPTRGGVIEKTNQQLEAGTLTKSFSGTTLFKIGGEKK